MVLIIVDPTISLPPSNYLQDPKETFGVSAYLGGNAFSDNCTLNFDLTMTIPDRSGV